MPRGRMSEKHVQDAALKHLVSHYESSEDVIAAQGKREASVSKSSKLGYGRADGLVAMLRSDGTFYTASLEAKSSKIMRYLLARYRDERWLTHALIVGLIALLLVALVGWLAGGPWLVRWVLPIVAFAAVTFAYLYATSEQERYRLVGVLDQVWQYPANERWIAIPSDAYERLSSDYREALHAGCKREGVGLLRVRGMGQVKALEQPRPVPNPKVQRDFLECYAWVKEGRQVLQAQAASRKRA